MRVLRARHLAALLATLVATSAVAVRPGRAQTPGGLPAYAPINPVVASRSGLYFQPFETPSARRWRTTLTLDYASTIEYNQRATSSVLLDSELLRLGVGVVHPLSPRVFVRADATLDGAYAGFLDGFLDWYHHLIGVRMPEREARPHDRFAYRLALPDGPVVDRRPSTLHLGDLRLGVGLRHGTQLQSLLSVTLPSATGPAGYGRGVPSANLLETARFPLGSRFVYEGSVGVGVTPKHGPLAPWQRAVFASASSGLRARLWGRQTVFANVWYGSPVYERTGLPALDRRELSLDFGWIHQGRDGREWKIGMTEDLEPSGPGVDLVFRVGGTF
ncbi:MAG TPA: DUF3187 family protein [Gemmatimonadales bacterium]|nr:DUF3187 family protein [Gemmatimonadales bacterium]